MDTQRFFDSTSFGFVRQMSFWREKHTKSSLLSNVCKTNQLTINCIIFQNSNCMINWECVPSFFQVTSPFFESSILIIFFRHENISEVIFELMVVTLFNWKWIFVSTFRIWKWALTQQNTKTTQVDFIFTELLHNSYNCSKCYSASQACCL